MGKMSKFDRRLEDLPKEIWEKIAKVDELKGQWTGGLNLSPQVLGRLKMSVLITSSGASTRIEGAKLSDKDVERLMQQGVNVRTWAERDTQEVRGYYETLQNVFDAWKDIKFTENEVKNLHKEILKHTTKDERHRGEYKKQENTVVATDGQGNHIGVIFEPTKAYLTPKAMQELIEWTQKALQQHAHHSLLTIGSFLVEFLHIHPFQDGNGRLSRVLANLLLLQAGYRYMPYVSHEKFVEDNKDAYYLALRKSQKTFGGKREDITPWLLFFLDVLLSQSHRAIDLLTEESLENTLSQKQIAVWEYLQGAPEATQAEIAEQTNIARPTVDQAIRKLMRFKRVEKIGEGRATRYRKV